MSLATLIQNMGALAAKQVGGTGTLSRDVVKPGEGYDPITGEVATTTTTSPCLTIPDASSLVGLGFKFGQGLIQAGDIQIDIPNKDLTFSPAPGDKLSTTLDGAPSSFAIVAVQPEYFQGLTTVFSCLCRK